jgi:hypothetical protein
MRHVTISEDVEDFIGRASADGLRDGPFPDDFTCDLCGGEGFISAGMRVAVSVDLHPDMQRVVMNHEACGPSEIREDPRLGMPLIGELSHITPLLRVPGDDPRAVVLFSASFSAEATDRPGGDTTNLLLERLLEAGFDLVLGDPLAELQGGSLLPGWLIRQARGEVTITDPEGRPLYEGMTDPDDVDMERWLAVASEEGRCLLIAGDRMELQVDPIAGLDAAVEAGRVVAAMIKAEVDDSAFPGPRPKRAERRATQRALRRKRRQG